jgi:hypothetical protein
MTTIVKQIAFRVSFLVLVALGSAAMLFGLLNACQPATVCASSNNQIMSKQQITDFAAIAASFAAGI